MIWKKMNAATECERSTLSVTGQGSLQSNESQEGTTIIRDGITPAITLDVAVGDEVVILGLEVRLEVATEIQEEVFAFSGGIMEIAVLATTASFLTIRIKKSWQFWTFLFFSLLCERITVLEHNLEDINDYFPYEQNELPTNTQRLLYILSSKTKQQQYVNEHDLSTHVK